MCNVYPTLWCLDRHCACTVLYLCDCVILPWWDNNLVCADNRVCDVFAKTEAYSSAWASFDKIVLWTCVECVLSVNELRVKHNVSLLWRLWLEIRKSFPCLKILCPYDSSLSCSGRKIVWSLVLALWAEYTVYPAVLMLSKSHIVYVCFLRFSVRKLNREVPETEAVNRAVALCYCKKWLSVIALNSCNKVILAVEINSARVQYCVYAQSLHEVWICLRVHVIFPDNRCVCGCQNRVNVSVINSVVAVGHNVFSVDESLVFGCHPCFVSFKICHIKQFPFGKKSS